MPDPHAVSGLPTMKRESMAELSSCLIKNLSHYLKLSDSECELIASFEKEEAAYPKGHRLQTAGMPLEYLYAVKSGWLMNSVDLLDGTRQIVRICVPGDLIGLSDIGYEHITQNLTACNDVVVCPFPKRGLAPTLRSAPRLTALLMSIAAREQVITVDLLRAVGRMSANDRVASLLLQMLSRLRITVGPQIDGYDLPLSQTQIGDTIGLTNVSVSQALGALERRGDIIRTGKHLRICDPAALGSRVDFTDRYDTMDTSWFPG